MSWLSFFCRTQSMIFWRMLRSKTTLTFIRYVHSNNLLVIGLMAQLYWKSLNTSIDLKEILMRLKGVPYRLGIIQTSIKHVNALIRHSDSVICRDDYVFAFLLLDLFTLCFTSYELAYVYLHLKNWSVEETFSFPFTLQEMLGCFFFFF